MFFQLLHGVHVEKSATYRTEWERDEQGVLHYTKQPVIETERDLVAQFGSDKFRRVNDIEAKAILGIKADIGEKAAGDVKTPAADTTPETEVSKAAKKGATAIAEPPGKDVTSRFDGAGLVGFTIFRKAVNKYVVSVMKDGSDMFLTEEPITKKQVEKLIEDWSE